MSRFIISIILLFSSLLMRAQLFHELEEGRTPFVRLSFDPTVSLKTFLQKADMMGFEATIDSEIKQNIFLMGGIGWMDTDIKENAYHYSNTGMFGVIGVDFNLTKYRHPKDRDIFFVGLHYGFASFSQEASGVVMSNYWGSRTTSVARETLSATWLEVAMGMKVEMAKNIFIGWTGEVKFRGHLSSGEMVPYNIPGYGKNDSYGRNDSKVAFDLNFFISYAITMKPKRHQINIDTIE